MSKVVKSAINDPGITACASNSFLISVIFDPVFRLVKTYSPVVASSQSISESPVK
jgi:hypothetical protein